MERNMDMDFREPERHSVPEPTRPVAISPQTRHDGGGMGWLKALLALVLIAAAGAGAYYYRDTEAKDQAKKHSAEVAELQQQVSNLRNDLDAAKEEAAATQQAGPSDETLKKVQDAVKSGKYADIQSLIADKVMVIQAASEGLGSRTPTQAVADLKFLDGGTDPWDFALTSTVVSSYQDGDYAQYFPVGALVGKAANNYVVSFVFNNDGKVSAIFMANKADIL
jgi:type II secretory pathway pseudopilin PulG